MKTLRLCAILLAIFLAQVASPAQDAKAKHWYRLFLHHEDSRASIIANSTAPPAELATAFSGNAFVELRDLRVPASMTESSVLSWMVPEGTVPGGAVFVNPRHVVYFVEWPGEPKTEPRVAPAAKP